MNILLTITAILIIIVLPIPIKFTLYYYKNSLHIYLYKRNNIQEKSFKKVSHKIKSTDYIGIFQYYIDTARALSFRLKKNKLKPGITLSININEGFDDAARTAICFGVLYSFSAAVHIFINKYFKIKKYNYLVNPDFDNIKFEIQIKCIIWISIVNTIYIFILVLYTLRKGKRAKAAKNNIKSDFENSSL